MNSWRHLGVYSETIYLRLCVNFHTNMETRVIVADSDPFYNWSHLAQLPFSGDYTCGETHVPIPNTPDKPARPMIVPTSAKVGHCRNPTKERLVTEKL